jgi:hypothetical protein
MEINKSELVIIEAVCDRVAADAVPALNDQYLAYSGAVGFADVILG